MKINSLEYFFNIPDEFLIKMASEDWEQLELLCYAITLDLISNKKPIEN